MRQRAPDGPRMGPRKAEEWMVAFLRLAVIVALVLGAAYWLAVIYARSLERERLEKRFDRDNPSATRAERDAFVAGGMKLYEHGLRRRLLVLVVILPTLAIAVLVWLLNFQ